MTYEQLRATIIGRMLEFMGIDQKRIDYQNPGQRFEPPLEGVWCRLTIEMARPVVRGLCQPQARVPGNIIIQCFDRAISQIPTLSLVRLADALAEHFQFWESGSLLCREAQFISAGAGQSVGNPSGTGFTQANVQIYFIAG
ncbi:hypothetical protein JQS35_11010 [Alcaligenes faecalis subsp. faecalis]|uniref:hypothetical protein n=1 Tax=Alcaligenes faecalis TaxID=511 RepID=UPI001F20588B|nr:hypothetical protein [Alcaligenes faecalis]MBW4789128.1 hypothetical protein [Alcaligenes faecalis subsp. faecalis]